MVEPVVAVVMTRPAVNVTPNAKFKDVVRALLAGDVCAVPVVDELHRPIGTITEVDVLANLEFHGGTDPAPVLGGAAARRRWRKASAITAAELMAAPAAVVAADTRISQAARRLADREPRQLCVVDRDMRLVGLLTRRNLLSLYQRTDDHIEADVRTAILADLGRPTRTPAAVTVHVRDGVVTMHGELTYRSRAEHAAHAASRVAGVVAVRNHLTYALDDLMITGL
jgi:predicted transcriptional regulator